MPLASAGEYGRNSCKIGLDRWFTVCILPPMTTSEISPVAYYCLCADAAALGVPVSLDDPASPQTVDGLADALVLAEQRAWLPGVGVVFPLREEILKRYGLA